MSVITNLLIDGEFYDLNESQTARRRTLHCVDSVLMEVTLTNRQHRDVNTSRTELGRDRDRQRVGIGTGRDVLAGRDRERERRVGQ